MPSTVKAYGVTSSSSPVKPLDIQRRDVGADDVEIDIEYCGVCHSDIHVAHGDWNEGTEGTYPIVTGHEIIGKVLSVGPDVKNFKIGDKVGVGCLVDSCTNCPSCNNNVETFCVEGSVQTYAGPDKKLGGTTQGGYSDKVVVRDHFVVHIPDNIYGPAAAPLLCAGITTYSPLHQWGVKKGDKVGVAGYGGLGHMGVKFAAALGCEVYIVTTSEKKAKDLKQVEGVKGAIVSTNQEEVGKHAFTFDFILNTVPVPHNFDTYTNLLKPFGKQVLVGCMEKCEINTKTLIFGNKIIAGSAIGGLKETQEMIDFCSKHNIVSDIEMTDFQHINEAWDRVQKNDVRFRFVIDVASLQKEANSKDEQFAKKA